MNFDSSYRYHKYLDDRNFIKSCGSRVVICKRGVISTYTIDNVVYVILAKIAVFRRLFRLNRMNVRELENGAIIIVYNSRVYLINEKNVQKKIKFKFTRYTHDETIAVENNTIVIGEYGNSRAKFSVGVYISHDFGVSWSKRDLKGPGTVKNILSVRYDAFEDKYWVFYGESGEQSRIETYNFDWSLHEIIGSGNFKYRAISSFFLPDCVFWFMNNPGGDSFVVKYDRKNRSTKEGYKFPGPIWYSIAKNNLFFLSTASEENTSDRAHILFSKDCENWQVLREFKKDKLNKKYFLYGMISFPIQEGIGKKLLFYCEGLTENDNRMNIIDFADE